MNVYVSHIFSIHWKINWAENGSFCSKNHIKIYLIPVLSRTKEYYKNHHHRLLLQWKCKQIDIFIKKFYFLFSRIKARKESYKTVLLLFFCNTLWRVDFLLDLYYNGWSLNTWSMFYFQMLSLMFMRIYCF